MKIADCLNISSFEDDYWAIKASKLVANEIKNCCNTKNKCDLILTGGESAKSLYKYLFPLIAEISDKINFYFGDERCISPSSSDSNYNMVLNLLPFNFNQRNIYRIIGDADDLNQECSRYSLLLPEKIDILLLSIGNDAHIASIFPNFDPKINSMKTKRSSSPYHKYERITITKKVIDGADNIFCLAKGENKGLAMKNAFNPESTTIQYPARMVMNAHWLLDKSALNIFNS